MQFDQTRIQSLKAFFRENILSTSIGVGILVLVVLYVTMRLDLFGTQKAILTLSNHSNNPVLELSVKLYDEACEVERLAVGKSVVCSYSIQGDSHYQLSWQETGPARFSENFGYVTAGFDFHHRIIFLGAGEVAFEIENPDYDP